jgi:ribonucleoside-triphosphate reductase
MAYLRTYSRARDDGRQEKWFETVERVVNGAFTMQKRHAQLNNLKWD